MFFKATGFHVRLGLNSSSMDYSHSRVVSNTEL